MSKTINIITNQTTHQVTGDRLRTDLMEGGSQDWIPLEEYSSVIQKEDIEIDENGTYLATEYGGDVIGKVTVKFGDGLGDDGLNKYSGPGTLTGVDPLTGLEATVSLNADGEIVKEPNVPEGIIVTKPPDIYEYTNWDMIHFSGIVVSAYRSLANMIPFKSSELEGPNQNQIPFDQLTFPEPIALRDTPSCNIIIPSQEAIALEPSYTLPFPVGGAEAYRVHTFQPYFDRENRYEYTAVGEGTIYSIFLQIEDGRIMGPVFLSDQSFTWTYKVYENGEFTYESGTYYSDRDIVHDLTIYSGGAEGYGTSIIETSSTPYLYDPYWSVLGIGYLIFSDATVQPETENVSIPVQWQTEYQEAPFEGSFEIIVT